MQAARQVDQVILESTVTRYKPDQGPFSPVEIPLTRRQIAVRIVGELLLFANVGIVISASMTRTGHDPGRVAATASWINAVVCGVFGVAATWSILLSLKLPAFAVTEEGIRNSCQRNAPRWFGTSWQPYPGLLIWDEIDNCRWSRYQPGTLMIRSTLGKQARTARAAAERLFCWVPEPYRESVEKAIRTKGKWAA